MVLTPTFYCENWMMSADSERKEVREEEEER